MKRSWKDGMISLDSTLAKRIGFTSDKFSEGSYLWKRGKEMWISFIECTRPGRGDFGRFVKRLLSNGFTVVVPTPLGRMEDILRRNGYEYRLVFEDEVGETIETWRLEPPIGD